MSHFDSAITFCYTRDLPTIAAWYEQLLGLELLVDQGNCHIYRAAGQGLIGFCQKADAEAVNDLILTFVTDEVDEWYDRLVASGVPIAQPPRENPRYGIYHFFAHDPDGRKIEVQRFLSPDARVRCHQSSDSLP